MAHIPQSVLSKQPVLKGLNPRSRGKVRDAYDLPEYPDEMLVVASDRCSIFDFVLPTLVHLKGQILTALNHFWTTSVLKEICEIDLVACGAGIDEYLPEYLRNDIELQKRATVVRIVPAPDVEDIVRLYLTGRGWTSYQKNGTVCGHRLPPGLIDGSKLPYAIYTPTTKAEEGHDEHISAESVAGRYGAKRERLALQAAGTISAYAEERGIILADTKFEFSFEGGTFVLADEKGTPDSSRFWDGNAWKKSHAKSKLPPSFDKQYVREWGKKALIEKDSTGRKRDPQNPDDIAYIDSLEVPTDVIDMTTSIYRYIFWRLTGMQIEAYQRLNMGIAVEAPRRKIEILIGSKSDSEQIEAGLDFLKGVADVNLRVLSCHRNLNELGAVAEQIINHADVVIAGAGMAAALPGIMKSQLCMLGHPEIPVIGVAFKGKSERDDQAAILSIERLPGEPVELDLHGHAYFGNVGFIEACRATIGHEFLPKDIERKSSELVFKQFP
jgi:phosphoribosylaminoimidazole-succinocarboxamide synthase